MTGRTALIVAAGRGRRFGASQPKQYAPLGGMPLLRRTVLAFSSHPRIDRVRVVIHADDEDLYAAAVAGLDLGPPVIGGATRRQSVLNGLEALALDPSPPGLVLIHDAARPFVAAAIIDGVLDALSDMPGALPALAVTDTVKRARDGMVHGTVDRDGLYRAQTPQGFRFRDILAAHRAVGDDGDALTDDVAVAEAAGLPVALTVGSEDNFKVTTMDDLVRAERVLMNMTETRIGSGFDVHRFEAGKGRVILCGVEIPFDRGLAGHSDADVALHALTDAILGAVAEGDIGRHFPPSDPQWKGAASRIFLERAAELVRERRGRIVHVDLTVICEAPRLSPHTAAMRAAVADMLGIEIGRVSVKATTTEGLGFTGRGEGIAAQATATIALPASG